MFCFEMTYVDIMYLSITFILDITRSFIKYRFMFVINLLPLDCLAPSLQITYLFCHFATSWLGLPKGVHNGDWKARGGGRDMLHFSVSFLYLTAFLYQFFFTSLGLICFSSSYWCQCRVFHNILQRLTSEATISANQKNQMMNQVVGTITLRQYIGQYLFLQKN